MAAQSSQQDMTITLTTHPSSINAAGYTILLELLGLPYIVNLQDFFTYMEGLHDPGFNVSSDTLPPRSMSWYLLHQYDRSRRFSYSNESPLTESVADWELAVGQITRHIWLARGQFQQDKVELLCRSLEVRLRYSSSGWIVGDRLTLADITTFPYINFVQWARDPSTELYPRAKAWYMRLARMRPVRRGMEAVGIDVKRCF
ncbi:uncharacterized protein BDV17DRAFT_259457 [Aspergillus undulatus]|uniref:uncharacterized protein n=1 Tax=Aspergillus undulatus TaxID=1810928 RepID=UPI003CCD495B